jgi:hypothetical protein
MQQTICEKAVRTRFAPPRKRSAQPTAVLEIFQAEIQSIEPAQCRMGRADAGVVKHPCRNIAIEPGERMVQPEPDKILRSQ